MQHATRSVARHVRPTQTVAVCRMLVKRQKADVNVQVRSIHHFSFYINFLEELNIFKY
jgi:hypothetical protein